MHIYVNAVALCFDPRGKTCNINAKFADAGGNVCLKMLINCKHDYFIWTVNLIWPSILEWEEAHISSNIYAFTGIKYRKLYAFSFWLQIMHGKMHKVKSKICVVWKYIICHRARDDNNKLNLKKKRKNSAYACTHILFILLICPCMYIMFTTERFIYYTYYIQQNYTKKQKWKACSVL